ncbi:MAG: hypothetical protein Q8P77_02975 [Candidatus Veblenbacteria bacterium]|nr:hypothetical protein [Candidatus Veblenbacteria bacterium]
MGIIVGLIMVGAGFLITWKSEWIVTNFGKLPWAEQHLQSEGGTRLFYKLLGILLIMLGFLTMTGLLKNIGLTVLPRFFRGL